MLMYLVVFCFFNSFLVIVIMKMKKVFAGVMSPVNVCGILPEV